MSDESQNKRKYEKPLIRDLSGFGAAGETLGDCRSGGDPYTTCATGTSVGQGSCYPSGGSPVASGCLPSGTFAGVDGCTTGSFPESDNPRCEGGSFAFGGCGVGSRA